MNQLKKNLTPEILRSLMTYDPNDGSFYRIVSTSSNAPVGKVLGCPNAKGYLRIRVEGMLHFSHSLAWLYHYGIYPDYIDHRNGVPSDNRIDNLRLASHEENHQNRRTANSGNSSGLLGVSKRGKKWSAQINKQGQQYHLGYFLTPEAAYVAYLTAKVEMHPFQTLVSM
jgi:hypothetical protein